VVPSFSYRYYHSTSSYFDGTSIYKTNGDRLDNYPEQQLVNGRAKNTATGGRYKSYARALKNAENAENALSKSDVIKALPSYLMECLAWNVPNDVLRRGGLVDGFEASLVWLWQNLTDE
jgi:hypothetical protein